MENEQIKTNVEDQARIQGWVPKEEFHGDPDKWRTAEEFVNVGKNIASVQTERNSKLTRKVQDLEKQIDYILNKVEDVKKESYERAIKDIEAKQRTAVEMADTDEYDRLQQKKEAMKKPEPIKQEVHTPSRPSDDFIDWHSKNSWYMKNKPASAFADAIVETIKDSGMYSTEIEILEAVENEVRKRFPELSGSKQQKSVESPSTTSGATRGKTYDSLPPEDKKQCDKYVNSGLLTREQYVKDYYGL